MRHIIKVCVAVLACVFFSIATVPAVQAAPQATIQVNAEINGFNFWECTFIKDNLPSKPAVVKVEWSIGNNGSNQKEATLIAAGKTSGQVAIVTEKGELVNISICVKNSRNEVLGKWGTQLTNKGQTESVTISLPDTSEPVINRN